ncbi:MAG: DUF3488 domain-containing protein [Myxococcales bacterium]|nr:DUF3488 domain-containing protein [Myxococcales bacterium]
MRFIVVHKVCTYLMVGTALAAVLLGGDVGPVGAALVVLATAASWFWEAPRVALPRYEKLWNIATLAMLVRAGVAITVDASVLQAVSDFVLFLTVNRLFNRRTSREYQQLYVLSFLQMTAATVLNAELSYGLLFLLYVVASTWTLILFHLKREMEENYLLKYGESLEGRPVRVQRVMNSRKLVGPRFLVVTCLLSLGVFAGAATVFFLFPRVGFGYFFGQRRGGITMSGFTDQVELGHFGVIKNDPTVVMRVEFPRATDREALAPYWRALAFDHYDGHRWTKSRGGMDRPIRRRDGVYPVAGWGDPADPVVEQRIYLEPMEARVLFGLSRLEAVALDAAETPLSRRRTVRQDPEGDVVYEQPDQVAFRYTAYSRREPVPAAALGAPLAAYREAARRQAPRYLQLPLDLDPRVAALAAEIIGDAPTVGEAARRVERWLESNLRYSLDLGRDDRYAPLEDFLFVQRRGHCEYFATAMIILLRTQGIAARNVNGFLGGTWNSFGGYLAISQGEAHSWVELWLGPGQWVTRDPTPGGPPRAVETGLFTRLREMADALRLRWYKYIIEYDLDDQASAFHALRDVWQETLGRSGGGGRPRTGVLVALAVLVAALILIPLVRRRRAAPAQARRLASEAAADLLDALVRTYRRRGFDRRPGTTAREYADSLLAREAPGAERARAIIERYEGVRFGGEVFAPDELRRLRAEVRTLGREPT